MKCFYYKDTIIDASFAVKYVKENKVLFFDENKVEILSYDNVLMDDFVGDYIVFNDFKQRSEQLAFMFYNNMVMAYNLDQKEIINNSKCMFDNIFAWYISNIYNDDYLGYFYKIGLLDYEQVKIIKDFDLNE